MVDGPIGPGWNPTTGCTRVGEGCDHCYAFQLHDQRHVAWKRGRMPDAPAQYHQPFSQVQLLSDRRLDEPLHWRKPRRIFVDSMADLFHRDVPDEFIDRVFGVMARTPHHAYRILTKRPERMQAYMAEPHRAAYVAQHLTRGGPGSRIGLSADEPRVDERTAAEWSACPGLMPWPLANLWLGTSTENQRWGDERIPPLLQTPAAVRFISVEPLLDRIDLSAYVGQRDPTNPLGTSGSLHWVVVGGESGPFYREMQDDWVRLLRDQCLGAGVAFYFKQHSGVRSGIGGELDGVRWHAFPAACP